MMRFYDKNHYLVKQIAYHPEQNITGIGIKKYYMCMNMIEILKEQLQGPYLNKNMSYTRNILKE